MKPDADVQVLFQALVCVDACGFVCVHVGVILGSGLVLLGFNDRLK